MDATEIGRRLAGRHTSATDAPSIAVDEVRSLLNYAETPHFDDWTMRSALVRLAQRDPARVGALLQVSRRLDGPLHHVARTLQAEPAICDGAMARWSWDPEAVLGQAAAEPYPDVRVADLARAVAAGHDADRVLAGYQESRPLGREEVLAVPVLAEAARFDLVARDLARWASSDLADPPLDTVDQVTAMVAARLDELGVPEETGPPPRGSRSRG